MLRGWDPLKYLSISDPTEVLIARAVLERGQEMEARRMDELLKNLGVVIQNAVAKAFSK